jgi:hypothetical protein
MDRLMAVFFHWWRWRRENPERVKHKGTAQAVTTAELERSERRRYVVAARLPILL